MNLNDPRTVLDVAEENFVKFSNNPAFTCMGQTMTYGELDVLSKQFAAYLQNHTNLQPGDRVAVQMPNILQYPVAMFGIARAGMILVNTNPLYTARELKHQLNDSGAKAIVVLANIADTASKVVPETSVEQVIVTEIGDMHGFAKRLLINNVVKLKKMVPEFSFKNQVAFRDVLAKGKTGFKKVSCDREDVAVLQYTGGTTGVAKGAMLTHRNLVSNMLQLEEQLEGNFLEGQETYVAPLPLYHIYAFTVHCMAMMASGNHSILIPNPRDLDSFVKAMKGQRITGFVGLNTLFNGLAQHQGFRDLDFSTLKSTASGGMALTSEVGAKWREMTGVQVSEGFGMTETSPVVSAAPPGKIQDGTVGYPVPGTEVRVTDSEGNVLPAGEPGELWVRGPQVMKGYWERPEATAETIDSEGWLDTGDMAVIQEDGYIRIVDRKKDMIIVSGFNVYPNEIEDVVGQCPGVLEAAAIGVADAKTGEAVKVFAVKEDASITDKDVIAFCRENLTGYKVPKQIEFREELPKSNVGKILRRELKDEEQAKGNSQAA
ncbi:long-chain-fatty-acid--CoA ligase FadD1 [Maricurvus nonylphenolicus]|uniref:AMP-binding protein n=1 Tax=Maricurvus nonylphenolicus TaxID=1008307 RepID=UPI0036F2F6C3